MHNLIIICNNLCSSQNFSYNLFEFKTLASLYFMLNKYATKTIIKVGKLQNCGYLNRVFAVFFLPTDRTVPFNKSSDTLCNITTWYEYWYQYLSTWLKVELIKQVGPQRTIKQIRVLLRKHLDVLHLKNFNII